MITTSEKAKFKGFKSLKEVAELTEWSTNTLRAMDERNPEEFDKYLDKIYLRRGKCESLKGCIEAAPNLDSIQSRDDGEKP